MQSISFLLVAGFLALHGAFFLGAPLLLHAGYMLVAGVLIALTVLTTTTFWALVHEGIHGHLHPSAPTNDRRARLLSICFGAPFETLKIGHLLHHRFSRTAEISEGYDPAQTPAWKAHVRHYALIGGGLYLAEVLGGLVLLLPQRCWEPVLRRFGAHPELSARILAYLARPAVARSVRIDALLVIALFSAAFTFYGENAGWLVLALAGRAFLVSFFDNAYHYGTTAGRVREARNLRLPRCLSVLILHFNLHGVHHREPGLPWFRLPDGPQADLMHAGYLGAALSQLRGAIPYSRLQKRVPER